MTTGCKLVYIVIYGVDIPQGCQDPVDNKIQCIKSHDFHDIV